MRREPPAQTQGHARRARPLGFARRRGSFFLFTLFCLAVLNVVASTGAQAQSDLTPLQRAIRVQTARLSSADVEERRDAVVRLGALGRPEGSRAASVALADASPIIRATAARAVLSLGRDEAATLILPLLRDRDEFVRRASAISLGQIASRESVPALVEALSDARAPNDVRRECARALGIIGDPAAAPALRSALSAQDPYLSRIAFEALKKIDPQGATRPGV